MFVSRAAARRRLARARIVRALVREMNRTWELLFMKVVLYGTSHPEALIDYQPNGEDDVRA